MSDKNYTDLKEAVSNLLKDNHHFLTKKEICRLLDIKKGQRKELKGILSELRGDGYDKKTKRPFDSKLNDQKKKSFTQKEHHLGLIQLQGHDKYIVPCHRKDPFPMTKVDLKDHDNVNKDEVILFRFGPSHSIQIDKVIGSIHTPHIYSQMAIYNYSLPHTFSEEALKIAKEGSVPPLGKRKDYRHIPLITIDGEDARDFDDAVWAAADTDPNNEGGWRIIVAIADVSHYVQPENALDQDAYARGNSVYFADHVVPMLPEMLSNELCSLKPHEDRACLAVEMIVTQNGKIKSHHFYRGLMRSKARLTYNQVQQAINGNRDKITEPLWDIVLKSLYGAYKSFLKSRYNRGTLDLNMPERKVQFDEETGRIKSVIPREQLQSHQLIEELMIAANVSAAKTLLIKKWPTLFRIHDAPETVRVENLKTILKSFKINVPRVKNLEPSYFNGILQNTKESIHSRLINDLVLRCQSQARYAPANIGHFGLSLQHYCHFTSPIRRYADLIVHRCLIQSLELGSGGQEPLDVPKLEEVGNHISTTERTAAMAEREVMDRYLSAYLENEIGKTFEGIIVGVSNAGIFVGLDDNGAQGFISKSRLPGDYYIFDASQHRYIGERTKKIYQLGQPLTVLLEMADPITCSINFSLPEQQLREISQKNLKLSDKNTPKKLVKKNSSNNSKKNKIAKRENKKPLS